MIPKRTPYRNRKILDAARGEECTMQLVGICNGNPETTVAAHSNYGEDGKGMGQKADDVFVAFACSDCHARYDQRPEELRDVFHRAMKKTWRRLLDRKILK